MPPARLTKLKNTPGEQVPTHAGRGGTTVLARSAAHVNEKDLFMFVKVSIKTALNVNGQTFSGA